MDNLEKLKFQLKDIISQKENQGYNVRMKNSDTFSQIINELCKLENLNHAYHEELLLVSKFIRRNVIGNCEDKRLYRILFCMNYMYELFTGIIGEEIFWDVSIVTNYVEHISGHLQEINLKQEKSELIGEIYVLNMKKIIKKKWDSILNSGSESRAFIEIFDDIFSNAITVYPEVFIKKLSTNTIMCRMVKEKECGVNRFIPLKKTTCQNRWNPPGKSFLYMAYGEQEHMYNQEISLEEKVCLLECRTESNTDVCFCNFEPVIEGEILDLSYENITTLEVEKELEDFKQKYVDRIIEEVLAENKVEEYSLNSKISLDEVKKKIESKIILRRPDTKEFVTVAYAKQFIKLMCSCIYAKVDGTEEEKEREYKSFHMLSNYLISKGITGIIYPCTRKLKLRGKNIVLFEPNDAIPIKDTVRSYHYR